MFECLLCSKKMDVRPNLLLLLTGYVPVQERLCNDCWQNFKEIGTYFCSGCGRVEKKKRYCLDCRKWQKRGMAMLENQALYQYNEEMKDYMARYKFIGDYRLAPIFAGKMRRAIRRRVKEEKIDMILPIPLSEERMAQRGFNQVEAFLPVFAKKVDLLAVKASHKIDQSSKSRSERLKTRQPFELKAGMAGQVAGKHILLVDDVYTTGRTLYHAAQLLRQAGARKVSSQTLAR
ncbi:ComF family protein [Fructobacillus durionis]|uniref:Competence protein ComFC n=1 Tax=Fructobacillus durionis TaxID=283737 RepID=A0A1I1G716_9LACO|nr:ComF family protein [Fructobacillus durionis]SFC07122.1 competence protein ComFC [Fructobacillus durionis]